MSDIFAGRFHNRKCSKRCMPGLRSQAAADQRVVPTPIPGFVLQMPGMDSRGVSTYMTPRARSDTRLLRYALTD